MTHAPVLLAEALDALAPRNGGLYVDATFGGGGYSRAILGKADCRIHAYDRDPDAIDRGAEIVRSAGGKFTLHQGRFGDLSADEPVDGVVFDLGVSSFQLDQPARGFSFQADADLDMRMEKEGPSAAEAVNRLSEGALADLIYRYGEDERSRRIARAIVRARESSPIVRTVQLADIVERAVGGRKGARAHPATKTFQALRMLVNDELGELARGLRAAERALKPEGRVVVVAFHSLEDRMVKQFLVERAGAQGRGSRYAPDAPPARPASFRLEQKSATTPSEAEIAANPRARSARMRWAVRTAEKAWDTPDEPALAPRAEAEWRTIR